MSIEVGKQQIINDYHDKAPTTSLTLLLPLRGSQFIETTVIPKGHVWLAGDNVSNSTDSRRYGPVSTQLLRGKVVVKLFPQLFKPFEWVESKMPPEVLALEDKN